MTTTVYRLPQKQNSLTKSCLVAHLRSTTPLEAIDTLSKAGVLAIPGPDPASIVLVGYRVEIQRLLRDFRLYGYERHTRFTMERLKSLASKTA